MDISQPSLVIFQDETIVVANKPAGLLTIQDGYQPDLPNLKIILEGYFGHLWTIHRLDRETSGLIIFARTATAHRNLNLQFQNRTVCKIYNALATGVPTWERIIVDLPLRVNGDRKHRTVIDDLKGKPASTEYGILRAFNGAVLVEAIPKTGYTHQIRAHLTAIGHPILGDLLYNRDLVEPHPNIEINRVALHALSIKFRHPLTECNIIFHAPYPVDFCIWLDMLRSGLT